jgi:hypothetical protein
MSTAGDPSHRADCGRRQGLRAPRGSRGRSDQRQRAVSGSSATSPHGAILTGAYSQISGIQRHSPAHGRTTNQRSHRRGQPIKIRQSRASGGPCSGMVPGWARKWWVTRGAGIPSRRHRGVAGLGSGSSSFSASGAPAGPRPQTCFKTSSPTRRDTRFRTPIFTVG